MAKVSVARDFVGSVSAAEGVWYDPQRWPSWIDGFSTLSKLEGPWPERGARVVWDSRPGGRGRVIERVTAYEARTGQTLEIEDPRMHGTQTVAFEPLDGGVEVTLSLDYQLKPDQRMSGPLFDLLFIRRPMRDSLTRTLRRFGVELAADLEL